MAVKQAKGGTLFDRVLSAQSHYVLLLGLIPGFALVFGSIFLGIEFYTAYADQFALTRKYRTDRYSIVRGRK